MASVCVASSQRRVAQTRMRAILIPERMRTTDRAITAARTTSILRATDLCQGETTYTYQRREYGLTEIGDYCWFRQNLEATAFANGEDIPLIDGNSAWNNAGSNSMSAYRMYGDDTFYSDQYGLHYNGWAARDDRGLCPSGFAVPVKANFENLLASATENQLVRPRAGTIESWNGNNESGFSLIPAGYISRGSVGVSILPLVTKRSRYLLSSKLEFSSIMAMNLICKVT